MDGAGTPGATPVAACPNSANELAISFGTCTPLITSTKPRMGIQTMGCSNASTIFLGTVAGGGATGDVVADVAAASLGAAVLVCSERRITVAGATVR